MQGNNRRNYCGGRINEYAEWGLLLIISGLGIALANFVGFEVGFMDSLPGILILLAISAVAVVISKVVPLNFRSLHIVLLSDFLWQAQFVRQESSSLHLPTRSISQRLLH